MPEGPAIAGAVVQHEGEVLLVRRAVPEGALLRSIGCIFAN